MMLTYNRSRAMIMTHTCAKGQGQRSLGSNVKSGNRRTDGGDCITFCANAVGESVRNAVETFWSIF